jgi:hypothetical protein
MRCSESSVKAKMGVPVEAYSRPSALRALPRWAMFSWRRSTRPLFAGSRVMMARASTAAAAMAGDTGVVQMYALALLRMRSQMAVGPAMAPP